MFGLPRQINGKHVLGHREDTIGRIVADHGERGPDSILVTQSLQPNKDYSGYAAVLTLEEPDWLLTEFSSTLVCLSHAGSLQPGDIVAIRPSGAVRVLYRRHSIHNGLFVTGRCNSHCIMCSQPPRPGDDSALLREAMKIIELADPATIALGITGGEPTLLGEDLILLLSRCRDLLPATAIQLLTNGRLFHNRAFVNRVAAVDHPNLTVAIPLYSEIDNEHDSIVGAKGAFEQTVLGILSLARNQIAIELRTVVHRLNASHLQEFSDFVYRNLPFVSHVTFMGMEPTGLALANMERLWIDPVEYSEALAAAVRYLSAIGLNVSVFNHQLCTLPRSLWPFCRQSISDWKRSFLPICDHCAMRSGCGGFFDSALSGYHSRFVAPLSSSGLTDSGLED